MLRSGALKLDLYALFFMISTIGFFFFFFFFTNLAEMIPS